MKLLEERILKDGIALNENVLKVDSFLNHQVDVNLMSKIGDEFYNLFKNWCCAKLPDTNCLWVYICGRYTVLF